MTIMVRARFVSRLSLACAWARGVGRDQTSDLSPCLVPNAGLTEVW